MASPSLPLHELASRLLFIRMRSSGTADMGELQGATQRQPQLATAMGQEVVGGRPTCRALGRISLHTY